MRRFFDVLKRQINKPKTMAATVAAVSLSVAMMLQTGKAPTIPTGDVFVTKPVDDANENSRVRNAFLTIATRPLGNDLAPKPIKDSAAKPDGDGIAAKSDGDAGATPIKDAIAPKLQRDAIVPKPSGDSIAPKPNGDAVAPKAIKDATPKPDGDAIATNPAGDAIVTKPANYPAAPKKAPPIQQATLAYEWQDWQYCLAPSLAEHKIYLSAPIPVSVIVASADAAFHEMLNNAGIFHDEVQCPKAPNKRTLLFRQRYAIKLNEEIGNATINLNWEPHVD